VPNTAPRNVATSVTITGTDFVVGAQSSARPASGPIRSLCATRTPKSTRSRFAILISVLTSTRYWPP
jgi:hypothetical protein